MKIFLLEDDGTRVRLFHEALFLSGIMLDHTPTVWGPGGATEIFDPPYDLMLLDHDLGQRQMVSMADPETGTAFVQWLVAEFPNGGGAVKTLVHSYNTRAADWMVSTLLANGYPAAALPFGLRLLKILKDIAHDRDNL